MSAQQQALLPNPLQAGLRASSPLLRAPALSSVRWEPETVPPVYSVWGLRHESQRKCRGKKKKKKEVQRPREAWCPPGLTRHQGGEPGLHHPSRICLPSKLKDLGTGPALSVPRCWIPRISQWFWGSWGLGDPSPPGSSPLPPPTHLQPLQAEEKDARTPTSASQGRGLERHFLRHCLKE